MDITALLRGIVRQLWEDGAITGEQYGKMIRFFEKNKSRQSFDGSIGLSGDCVPLRRGQTE